MTEKKGFFKKLFSKEEVEEEVNISDSIVSPLAGKLAPITEVEDEVFSQKVLGDGFCIVPTNGEVVSPVDGEIVSIFDTKHAITILSSKGLEILIHVGIDTVTLNGEGFEAFVANGDKIKKGQKILKADLDFIQTKGLKIVTPIVFTNIEDKTISLLATGDVTAGQENIVDIK